MVEIVLLHLRLITTNHFHFLIIEEYENIGEKNNPDAWKVMFKIDDNSDQ